MSVRRPAPDPGVAAAVESCLSNTKMKRMVMFGLRALSELCTPPRGRYKENSLDAVQRSITPGLVQISANMSDDEEVMELVMKVCWGISQAFQDYKDQALINQFQQEEGPTAVAAAVNSAPNDSQSISTTFGMIDAFASIGAKMDATKIAPGLMKALGNTNLSPEANVKVASAINTIAHNDDGAKALAEQGAAAALVNFATAVSANTDSQSTEATYFALVAAGCVAAAGGGDAACVMMTKDLIDRNKGRKKILDAGSEALAGMLTLDQLSHSLEALNYAETGSPERTQALELLGAMSYVQAFAEAIVESGCVPLLIQAVNSTIDDLAAGNREDTLMKGFAGTVNLLGKIASNPSHAATVYDNDGMTAICGALANVTDHGEGFAACCSALAALANADEAYATEMYSSFSITGTVLGTLYEQAADETFHLGALELLAALSQHESVQAPMIEESAVEIIGYSMQYGVENLVAQLSGFKALSSLAPSVYTSASIYEYGGFQGIARSLAHNVGNEDLAGHGVRVLSVLSNVADAKSYAADGVVVDAVLYAMLEHSHNAVMTAEGTEVLDNLATVEDAERHVQALDGALANAIADSDSAFKALAACKGLCSIKRLSQTFETANAANKIIQHTKRFVDSPGSLAQTMANVGGQRITLQEKLLRGAFSAVEAIALNTSGSLDGIIPEALAAAGSEKIKTLLVDGNKTPETMFASICTLAAANRMSSKDAINKAVGNASECLKKFSDYRTLTEVILDIIFYLSTAQGGVGVAALADHGGLKAVLDQIKKLPFSEKTQINGFKTLAAVLAVNPDYADMMRSAGTVDLVQTALRTHQRSSELRSVVAPIIAQLIPVSELEEIASRNIAILREALDVSDYKKAIVAMKMCNDIGVCAEGAKALARQGAPRELKRLEDIAGIDGDKVELYQQGAHMASLMAGNAIGEAALKKSDISNVLMKLLKDLSDAQNEEGIVHALNGIGVLLQGDRAACNMALKRNIVQIVTKLLEDYPNHATIVPAACRVLGALARTDEQVAALTQNQEVVNMITEFNEGIGSQPKIENLTVLTRALADLVRFENQNLMAFVMDKGLVPTLVDVLEKHPEDRELVKNTAEAIQKIGKNNYGSLRDYWENQSPKTIKEVYATFTRCINENLGDEATVLELIRALARFPLDGEFPLLKEAGAINAIRQALALYPNDACEIACAEILESSRASSAIPAFMQQAIDAEASGDLRSFNDALENLNLLLLTTLEDPDNQLAQEEELWPALTRMLQNAVNDGDLKTMRNCLITAQRLTEQGKSNPDGYRGAWYFSQTMLPVCYDMIENGGPVLQVQRALIAMMHALTAAAENPNTRQIVLDGVPVVKCYDILDRNKNDINVTAAVARFLNAIASDESGVEILKRKDIVPLLSEIMKGHRGRVQVNMPIMDLTANMAKPGSHTTSPYTSPAFTSGDAIRAANIGTSSGAQAQGILDANMMGIIAEAIKNPAIKSAIINDGNLIKCMKRLESPDEKVLAPQSRREMVPGAESFDTVNMNNHYAFAKMLEAYGHAGEGVYVREKGGMKKLLDMLDEYEGNPKVYCATIEAIIALSLSDPLGAGAEMRTHAFPKIIGDITQDDVAMGDYAEESPEIGKLLLLDEEPSELPRLHRAWVALRMLEATKEQPDWEEIRKHTKVQYIISKIEEVADAHGDEELMDRCNMLKEGRESAPAELQGEPMGVSAPGFGVDVDPEDPNALTLKQVHDWLKERIDANESIDINDASEPMLYERFQFVFTRMTDYVELMLVLNDFAGYQSQWGCKAWALWVTYTPEVLPLLLEWGVHHLLFDYINTQVFDIAASREKDVVIATPPSAALACFANVKDPGATTLAALPDVAPDCTNNINMCVDKPEANMDEHIIPRVEMVEKIAINRNIFWDPAIILALLHAWDQYDQGIYSTLALRHIFRAMRRVVCDSHTDTILEHNVTQRLIDELMKDFDNPLLIDGFFLLGILAVDNRLKTRIGEQRGVEETLIILANHMEDPPGEGVITNSQLALANLVVGHRANCNLFHKNGGLQLNVRVLNERGEHFDETNAASALLTNACFRREDIKAAYGEASIGAPSALSYAISCYDGGTDASALRCLSNLFKAISNMSLYTPNVEYFLDSGLENAYFNLLMQSEGLPDEVIKIGLFTLSNLTWENREENMVKFGIIVPPLIATAGQGHREDVALLANSLETLAFLCRLPVNSQQFCEYGGVHLAVQLVQSHGNASSHLVQQAAVCLGTAARTPDNIQYLLSENVLELMKDVLEGNYYQEEDTQQTQYEISITALKVIRRIIVSGGGEVAGHFSQSGGTATLVWYLESVAATEDPLSQLALEALRTLIGAIAMAQGDDVDAYMPMEDQIDLWETGPTEKKSRGLFGKKKKAAAMEPQDDLGELEKPEGPRGYEVLGFDAATIRSLVNSVMVLCQNDNLQRSLRFMRCAMGFFCYVAAENIPGCESIMIEYAAMCSNAIKCVYEEIGATKEITVLIISLFGNVGYHNPGEFRSVYGKNSQAFKTAGETAGKIITNKDVDKEEKERIRKVKDRLDEFLVSWRLVNDGDDAQVCFRKFAAYETDFAFTAWYKDPYPNGVHDLLIKEELRTGGRLKLIMDEKSRDSFFWRANQTLALFQWRIEKDKNVETEGRPIMEFNAGVPVSKISNIFKGLGNDILRRAAKKQRGISADLCLVIQGPPTEDFPNGFDFGIKCKTKQERDTFVDWLLEWREACAI